MRVLTITAAYDDAGQFLAEPGFVVEGVPTPDAERGTPALDVEILDARGRTMHAARVPWLRGCAPPATRNPGGTVTAAIGLVPFDQGAAGLRVTDRGRVLLERLAPKKPLAVKVAWPPPVKAGEPRTRQITWDSDPGTLAAPAFSPDQGATWLPIGLPSGESPLTVDLTNVPGSDDGRLRLVVSDGLRTVTVESDPWALAPSGWVGAILTPPDGSSVAAGRPVHLAGQAIELEARRWADGELQWSAEGLGALGVGRQIEVAFPPGVYQISLRLAELTLATISLTATATP